MYGISATGPKYSFKPKSDPVLYEECYVRCSYILDEAVRKRTADDMLDAVRYGERHVLKEQREQWLADIKASKIVWRRESDGREFEFDSVVDARKLLRIMMAMKVDMEQYLPLMRLFGHIGDVASFFAVTS
jgi:hypothetical protein